MRKALALWLLALTTCGLPPGSQGYVLLSAPARRAGLRVESRGLQVAPALPFGLPVDEPAHLLGEHSRTPLELGPGEVLVIGDAPEHIERLRLGRDVRADQLTLVGEPGAVAELARTLDARVVATEGSASRVEAPDLFERTGFVDVPAGVTGAEPVRLADLALPAPTLATPPALPSVQAAKPGPAGEQASSPAELVGIYQAGKDRLVLSAGGTFSLSEGCSDTPRTGTWRLDGGRLVLVGQPGAALSFRAGERGALVSPVGRAFHPTEE